MDIRKDSLSGLKVCRFCLSRDEALSSLYERNRAPKNSVTLPLKILSCVSIEVFPSDKMPSFICNRCKFFMELSYEFKQICRQADEKILQYVQNATALSPVPWATSLINVFESDSKPSADKDVLKTVVEGGATIQVSTQDSDSDDDDDEDADVFNIKIGDGSDDGPKNAQVKVIATPNKQTAKSKKGKDSEDMDRADVRAMGGLQEGCWACDECDCTYPLQQLLELHKRQKHRSRSVQCDKCDAKFFSNYDLITHQLRHSDEMIFQCVACDKKFKRLIRLKRHEKIVHADIPQQPCPNCPATFLSQEELQAHQKRHIRNSERRYICPICDKRFCEKATLQRHKENIHDKSPEFSCEYCPQRFTTVSKLTRHVRAHASERAYPCKYCDKSFLKSHHYTRHLRVKHRETVRSSREGDQYRCEQCEDTFAAQDDLIYHSAIHATQNLTCPLCQERFPDVDAVTAHIKSHVNGTEFMCDLCELVFTSKEKLDNHITLAHDDELRNNSEDLGLDESSMELDAEDDEDDTTINVKEEDDHMVVEIKKPDEFMIPDSLQTDAEEKNDNTNSEDSEAEVTYAELATVDTLSIVRKEPAKTVTVPDKITTVSETPPTATKAMEKRDNQTASILRKAEEIKRKVSKQPETESVPEKKVKPNNKSESSNITGASDKSLRLLEKDLQELKRTNTRSEAPKTPAKPVDIIRNRRHQIHTSTPKIKTPAEEKKSLATTKSPAPEKKLPERRVVTKENKEPKESKELKESKEPKENKEPKESKETKGNGNTPKEDKETKEKDPPKNIVKNGTSDKSATEEGVRRSTRPSKIKDYAKMIRDRSQDSDDEDEDSNDTEEYKEEEKSSESRAKPRRSSNKAVSKSAPTPVVSAPATTPARKRGRPRKLTAAAAAAAVPPKVRKEDNEADEEQDKQSDSESKTKESTPSADKDGETKSSNNSKADPNISEQKQTPGGVLVSPTGQTLKKIPIKSLPPGVKPLPLPVNARPVGSGEVCEMQIGKKVVKVQKIVMTKAEVEAMAKKGLVEMKDGTMVLKQGIKLPTIDSTVLKSTQTLIKDEPSKESPTKKDKATPTRCELGEV